MQFKMQYSPSLIYFTGKYIIEMKDRVTVLKIENFTKPLYRVILKDYVNLNLTSLWSLMNSNQEQDKNKVEFINENNDRVMVMHIENFTKPLYQYSSKDLIPFIFSLISFS